MNCVFSVILIGTFVMYSEVGAGGSDLGLENNFFDNLLDMIDAIKSGSTNEGGNNRPAFTATLKTHSLTLSGNNDIAKFDNVILNRGNGYDPKTGKFTAPKSGLYQFSFTIMATINRPGLNMVVALNGKSIVKMYGGTETANPVLELKEGDSVYLTHDTSTSQQMIGDHYSYVSGYYIGE